MARKKKDLKAEIKKMEAKKREETEVKIPAERVLSFDSWFHQRKDKIAKCHKKEVIWADFIARGLKESQTKAEFDRALELYGIKLDR